MPSCSVIIVSYQTGPVLFAALKSALKQQGLAELILVDNGNPPDALARLQQMTLTEPRLKIVSSHGNIGVAKGSILGAEHATGDFMALLQPDCLLPPEALTQCMAAFDEVSGAMLAGCVVVNADGREKSAKRVTPHLLRGLPPPMETPQLVRGDMIGEVETLSPAFMCLRVADFKMLASLNEKKFDLDLWRYVQDIGAKVIRVSQIQVTQIGGDEESVARKRLMILASGLAKFSESKEFYGKTVFVTGATSDVGLCVVRRLIAAGASVLALSRGDAIPYQHEQLRWIKDDLDNKSCSLQGYYADMVVHCAPLWYLPAAIPMLYEADVRRVVAFSSTSVFTKAAISNEYERELAEKFRDAERDVENACNEKKIDWTILRPTLTYGTGLDRHITQLYRWIVKFGRMPLYPPGLGRSHPVHADDLALAVVQVMNNPATFGQRYNLSGGEIVTYRELLERLFKIAQKPARILSWTLLPLLLDLAGRVLRRDSINSEIAYRMNEDAVFFHETAKKDFGYAPRSFLSGGIRDMEGF